MKIKKGDKVKVITGPALVGSLWLFAVLGLVVVRRRRASTLVPRDHSRFYLVRELRWFNTAAHMDHWPRFSVESNSPKSG